MKLIKFWFVWNPSARIPQHRHFSRAEAQREAERLAKLHPGQQFIVLKAVGGAIVQDRPVEQIEFEAPGYDDLIPF